MDENQMAICEAMKTAVKSVKPKRTVKDIADSIAISPHILTNMLLGRTAPDQDVVDRLRKELKLPDNWPLIHTNKSNGRRVSLAGTPLAPIRIVGSASAGPGVSNVDIWENYIYVPERLSQIGGIGWLVEGESMMPVLENGDVAIFREGTQPRRGFTYLIHKNGEYKVKVLDWINNQWMMKSLNPDYPLEAIDGHQILGFLVGWYKAKGSRETLDSDPNGLIL